MCESETCGGSAASARSAAASCAGSCGASFRSGCGASGAGPSRKNLSRESASRSASQAAASFIRRYSASRRASSSAASSGPSSASSAASSGKSDRALSSSSAETRTRNSPHASRSSVSRSASSSTNEMTIAATSISARSSSSRRTSVNRRSNGPSKASRSSSSSRTTIARRLAAEPDGIYFAIEFREQLSDFAVDLVADRANALERQVLRIIEDPADPPQPGGEGTDLFATGRHGDVGPAERFLVELAWHVIAGVDTDLFERLDDRRMRRDAGLASRRARLVPPLCGPAEEPLGHEAAAAVRNADEEDVQRQSAFAAG